MRNYSIFVLIVIGQVMFSGVSAQAQSTEDARTIRNLLSELQTTSQHLNYIIKLVGKHAEEIERLNSRVSSQDRKLTEAKEAVAPKGIIGIFNTPECPLGWRFFRQARGRFILGAGETVSGSGLSPFYEFGEQSGEASHALNIDELPRHDHKFVGKPVSRGQWTGTPAVELSVGGEGAAPAVPNGHKPFVPEGSVFPTGAGQPHNNMPPYIALSVCEKQ